MIGKCLFNRKWLINAKFSWIKKFEGNKHKTMCCVCNKVIDIEHMGESTFKSHMKGRKHKRIAGASSSSTQSVLMATFSCNGAGSLIRLILLTISVFTCKQMLTSEIASRKLNGC